MVSAPAFASTLALGRHRPAALPRPTAPARHGCWRGVPGTWPLYAAYHPVTGDQLLTPGRFEPIDMGYGEPELLG